MKTPILICTLTLLAASLACAKPPTKAGREAGITANAPELPGIAAPELVKFPAGSEWLDGYVYKPAGKGPFRVMIWSYGIGTRLDKQDRLREFDPIAKAYLSDNYVLFVPDRRQLTRYAKTTSDSEKAELATKDASDAATREAKELQFLQGIQSDARSLTPAIQWIQQQSYVDRENIYLSGNMMGGIHSLFAAGNNPDVRGVIAFSPGIMTWETHPSLRYALARAISECKADVFIIQPQNDKTLGPCEYLASALEKKGQPNRTKVFPAFGRTSEEAHRFPIDGWETWGFEGLNFLDKCAAKQASVTSKL